MGYISFSAIKMPNLVVFQYLKYFIINIWLDFLLFFHLRDLFLKINPLHHDPQYQNYDCDKEEEEEEEEKRRPSPLLVPVPTMSSQNMSETVVKKPPVVKFGNKNYNKEDDGECAICLNKIEDREEIRELWNCCHNFHRECLDAWVNKGHFTCPLCRENLLLPPPLIADDHHQQGGELLTFMDAKGNIGNDPWRVERMLYLFGGDIVF